jgi:hypothetical protein
LQSYFFVPKRQVDNLFFYFKKKHYLCKKNKMYKKGLFLVLLSVVTICASAQKISGGISPLKNQKEVNLVLNFSGTLVNGDSEEKYIAGELKGKTEEEKTQWLSEWNENLRSNASSILINDLNKAVAGKWFSVGNYTSAEYTINVKVIEITTGFFAGVIAKSSAVKAEISFVKTGETNTIATVEFKKVSSKASNIVPYFVTRIAMSFGTLGDDLGSLINKEFKK